MSVKEHELAARTVAVLARRRVVVTVATVVLLPFMYWLLHDVAQDWADPALTDPADRAADVGRVRTAILGTFAGVIAIASALVAFLSLQQSGKAHRANQENEVARRANELYASAATQLGSDHSAVRLAGLYTFEKLGQEETLYRQIILDVWCAYLRMPQTVARDESQIDAFTREARVRATAQELIERHLRRGEENWQSEDEPLTVDLRGAQLHDLDLRGAEIFGEVYLQEARLDGNSRFDGAKLHGGVIAHDAVIVGVLTATETEFSAVQFDEATFHCRVLARDARFNGRATFMFAEFRQGADLSNATFRDDAVFVECAFHGSLDLVGTQFYGERVERPEAGPLSELTKARSGVMFDLAKFEEVNASGLEIPPGASFVSATVSKQLRAADGSFHYPSDGETLVLGPRLDFRGRHE